MIVKMQEESFINSWGRSEKYVSKEIDMELDGHINRGSAYSSSDSCGNCDGAKCETCRKIYMVCVYEKPIFNETKGYNEIKTRIWRIFDSFDEALEFYKKL